MKALTVKLDDQLATELKSVLKAGDYRSQSEVVREALRLLVVEHRRRRLRASVKRYLRDRAALTAAADAVEARMPLTEEALLNADG